MIVFPDWVSFRGFNIQCVCVHFHSVACVQGTCALSFWAAKCDHFHGADMKYDCL